MFSSHCNSPSPFRADFCVFMAAFYLNVFFSKCYPPNEQSRVAAACACLVLATKSTDALAAPHLPQVLKAFQKVHKDWRDPGVFAAAENVVIDAEVRAGQQGTHIAQLEGKQDVG